MHCGTWKSVMQNLKKQRSTSTSSASPETEKIAGIPFGPMPGESETPRPEARTEARTDARPTKPDAAHRSFKFKGARYRRIIFFFTLLFARIIFWEVVMRRIAGDRFVRH